ncbi:MAG: glutamine-hydrolyzing carbamoyl-phosphate synthase small subunit [Phycisphaerae bacterium]
MSRHREKWMNAGNLRLIGKLGLEDGGVFVGQSFGAVGTRSGEVVFNTAMTGYQEVFTDPSYFGQIVTMTFPLIGNYGVNPDDFESAKLHLSGFVVRALPPRPSNFRATAALSDFLAQHGVVGLAGVDTRALTRRIRIHGALRGVLSTEVLDERELVRMARESPRMSGANLVPRVTTPGLRDWRQPLHLLDERGGGPEPALTPTADAATGDAEVPHVVAIDCGIKHNILRYLREFGCRVTVAPADATLEQIDALAPDGLLVGNGPGDPAAVVATIETLRGVIGRYPIFGICLGHQMLALALGAETYKLRFGHHGANVPVRNELTGRVEITSQNHGFAVERKSLERIGAVASHTNLNDQSNEGFLHADRQLFSVQFHPEACPGPHDSGHLFRRFFEVLGGKRAIDRELFAEPTTEPANAEAAQVVV